MPEADAMHGSRRQFIQTAVALGAATLATGRGGVASPRNTLERSDTMSDELDLRADDPRLSPRARDLIRIGEVAIARENPAAAARFFHPYFRFHGPDGGTLTREQLWTYFAACRAAFDDFSVTRQQIFSDGGDLLAARTTFRGTFARPFTASPLGTLQPHGRPIFYRINNVFRYAANGALIEEWAQYDSRLFLEQLGVRLVPG
jgi:predicted ester cyclase